MDPQPGDIYLHFKQKRYEIVCLAKNESDLADLVIYRALYPVTDLGEEFSRDPIFVRTLENFCEVLPDGRRRFEKI